MVKLGVPLGPPGMHADLQGKWGVPVQDPTSSARQAPRSELSQLRLTDMATAGSGGC